MVFNDEQTYLGVTIDLKNNERPTAFIKNLNTNKMLRDRISNCINLSFSKNNKFVYYIKLDDNFRPYSVYSHILG